MSALANCSEYRELISASLDGALTPEEQEKLDAHLSECPDCRTMWEQLSALEPELMELSEPSEGFADRVLAAAETLEQDVPFTNLPQDRKPGKETLRRVNAWWKPIGVIAACCVFVLGGGWFVTHMWNAGSAAPSETAQATGKAEEYSAAAGADDAAALPDSDEERPVVTDRLTLDGRTYVQHSNAAELPDSFSAEGELTEEQAGNSGMAGHSYFTSLEEPGTCWVEAFDADGEPYYQVWAMEN